MKQQNKTIYHGNISLIMIFVLAIGSVIGLMSTHRLQGMIREASSMKIGYQNYYLAKAGIELGTLAIHRYDYGFSDNIGINSPIWRDNLSCTPEGCTIATDIISTITGGLVGSTPETIGQPCTEEKAIIISGGSSYIIPLYTDKRKLSAPGGTIESIFNNYKVSIIPTITTIQGIIGVGIILSTGAMNEYEQIDPDKRPPLYATGSIQDDTTENIVSQLLTESVEGNSLMRLFGNESNPFNYLAIDNTRNTEPLSFCLNFAPASSPYPLDTSIITSTAHYRNSALGLKAVITEKLADYINSVGSNEGI